MYISNHFYGKCNRKRTIKRNGKIVQIACGSPRCSVECCKKWCKRLASALERSFRVLPPTHHFRVTLNKEQLQTLRFRLNYRGVAWFRRAEFNSEGEPHYHFLLRSDKPLNELREVLRNAIGSGVNYSLTPIRSVQAVTKYIAKDLRERFRTEPPPADWTGRLYSHSKGFLTKPMAVLWQECRAEWYPSAEATPREATPGHHQGEPDAPEATRCGLIAPEARQKLQDARQCDDIAPDAPDCHPPQKLQEAHQDDDDHRGDQEAHQGDLLATGGGPAKPAAPTLPPDHHQGDEVHPAGSRPRGTPPYTVEMLTTYPP